MQKLLLAGRATKDAEIIEGKKGNFAIFSIAVNRVTSKDGEKGKEVSFYDIVCFGEERAKTVETFVKKGEKNSWGSKDRDALYLSYEVNLPSMKVVSTDTLVARDRAVTMEIFTPVNK